MSDRMTGVRPRAGGASYALWGRESRADAIEAYRKFYRHQLAEAAAALAWKDDELLVETYLGSWAQKDRKEVTE